MQGQILTEQTFDISLFREGKYTEIPFDYPAKTTSGESLTVTLTTQGCSEGNAIALHYGDAVTAGRFDINKDNAPEKLFAINQTAVSGRLCLRMSGIKCLTFYRVYWLIVLGVFIPAAIYACVGLKRAGRGDVNCVATVCTLYCKYRFLLYQLVRRDFKVKYKRSVLGMAWSLLNPLLTMTVQYTVFFTLFKTDISNYVTYLLCGIVLFNFFSEEVSSGMVSVSGNATLVKKVYVPICIFPISKLLSALINFGLTLIPLILVIAVTGIPFRVSMLLLLFDFLCMMCFVLGWVLILSTSMGFFRIHNS